MSMFLDAAHPRDRKFLRECLPAASSSESDSASDAASDEAESQPRSDAESSDAEGADSIQQPARRQLAGRKRARSPSPSSQDSVSPAPCSRRRPAPPVIPPALAHSSAPGGSRPAKRPVGRPREHPLPSDRPSNGQIAAEATQDPQHRQRVTLGVRQRLWQQQRGGAMQHELSRADRLAARRRRLQSCMRQQQPVRKRQGWRALTVGQHNQKAGRLQPAAQPNEPAPAIASLCTGQPESPSQPPQPAPLRVTAVAKPASHAIVRSSFHYASRALRGAAQLLSLRSRSLKSRPVSNGTRAKASRNAS